MAAAQHETVIYTFGSSQSDGFLPTGGLVADGAGNLYGTTDDGGGSGNGTVYELTPPVPPSTDWVESVLHRFGANGDGETLGAVTLVFDSFGNLYGTTIFGGGSINCRGGCGTVFELTPSVGGVWNETVIYSFTGSTDGAAPEAGVVIDGAGNLFGTTSAGGASGAGTAFELSPRLVPDGAWNGRPRSIAGNVAISAAIGLQRFEQDKSDQGRVKSWRRRPTALERPPTHPPRFALDPAGPRHSNSSAPWLRCLPSLASGPTPPRRAQIRQRGQQAKSVSAPAWF